MLNQPVTVSQSIIQAYPFQALEYTPNALSIVRYYQNASVHRNIQWSFERIPSLIVYSQIPSNHEVSGHRLQAVGLGLIFQTPIIGRLYSTCKRVQRPLVISTRILIKKKQQPMRVAFASPRLTILICPSCIINPVALAGAIDRERAAGVAGQKAPRPVFRPHPPSPLKYLNPKQSQTITMS